jgi:multicomponent Na+:H+ antiporter subunit A
VTALLALHAVLGLAGVAAGGRLGRRGLALGVLGPALATAWVLVQLPGLLDGEVRTSSAAWVPGLDLRIDLRLDGFAAVMALLVSGIGVLVFAYAARYLPRRGEGVGRLVGLLTLFSGSMLGLVLADHLLLVYCCWELTSITSYLLIGNDHDRPEARAAALHALLVTGGGGLAMLAGFILLGQEAGTWRLSELVADPPAGSATVAVALCLVLLGAVTKSAQVPFHSWLPGAMVAPTPVSAYLHSATMVKAGVYLVARLAPAFAVVAPWRPLVLTIGAVTMLVGGLRALRQYDLKLLLAHGTVSQLGFLVVLFGAGIPEATVAGTDMILAHAAFKAALFMVVGVVDHETGGRDLRTIPRLGRGWGPTVGAGILAAASMAGLPLLFGFVAKEAAFEAFASGGFTGAAVVLAAVVAGSALTVAYSARFVWGLLGFGTRALPPAGARSITAAVQGEAGDAATTAGFSAAAPVAGDGSRPEADHAPSLSFAAPAVLLAGLGVVLGVAPWIADGLIGAAARSLDPRVEPVHLAVWHGFNVALALSAVAVAVGSLLFAGRDRLAPVLALGARVPKAGDAYIASLRGLNAVADRTTAIVQSGSLPVYTGVILATAAVAPAVALIRGGGWPSWPDAVGSPAHPVLAVFLVGGALAASAARRRFSGALFLGAVGYGMAALFVSQGAPDLALTQVAIETLTTVVFVLVLRRLPDRFEHRPPALRRAMRATVAATVGVTVTVLALAAGAGRPPADVATEMVARSVPDGGGANVVNVILVDFRGWDTMGEITVLAVAAIGAVALARAGRRRPAPPPPEAASAVPPPADEGVRP